MKNIRFNIFLPFFCAAMGTGLIIAAEMMTPKALQPIEPEKPARSVYRIMIEQGVDEKQPESAYTPQEQQAVNDLKAVLSRWPKMMWLASVNGRLVLVKMGTDGKPFYMLRERK